MQQHQRCARHRGTSFDGAAKGAAFARAALIDPAIETKLTEAHRRLTAVRAIDMPRMLLAPIAPLSRDRERDAEVVASAWKR